jgi:hemerythrin
MDIRFKWTQDMSVNNDVIDAQHQELFAKINELLAAIINEHAEDLVEDMVHFFKQYMEEHLRYEENFLADIGYPETAEHASKHNAFVEKYKDLKNRLDSSDDKSKMVLEIENFMGSWLMNHIQVEDKKFGIFIAERNQ